jgi:hypothetical protein
MGEGKSSSEVRTSRHCNFHRILAARNAPRFYLRHGFLELRRDIRPDRKFNDPKPLILPFGTSLLALTMMLSDSHGLTVT